MGKKGLSSRVAANDSPIPILLSPFVSKAQDVQNITFHGLGETITIFSDNSMPSVRIPLATPADMPHWEELDVLLECFPTFTSMESLVFHINEFFLIMEWVPMV
ncbi:hypothetical protein PVL29_021011 [Vitis rotundifolia]|uniref:Uncharacterized protein n=1 Tax=Vitis rotundifolia TaxID=103349 RepID=A0AA38YYD0_VITRO|nr:hypothetical protein PVL29_021011 [Vitis rotundifolia]